MLAKLPHDAIIHSQPFSLKASNPPTWEEIMEVLSKALEHASGITWVFWRKEPVVPVRTLGRSHLSSLPSVDIALVNEYLVDFPQRVNSVDEHLMAEIDAIDRFFESGEVAEVDANEDYSETESESFVPTLVRSETIHLTRRLFSMDFSSMRRNSIDVPKVENGNSSASQFPRSSRRKSEEFDYICARIAERNAQKSDDFPSRQNSLSRRKSVEFPRRLSKPYERTPAEDEHVRVGCWARKPSFKRQEIKELSSFNHYVNY